MGIFSKSDDQTQEKTGNTLIPYGCNIIGGINTKGEVNIYGELEGIIYDASSVTIGITGKVVGDIQTKNIIVNGLVDGNIICENIMILKKGKVIGDITYNEMKIEKDGIFEGEGIKKNLNYKSRYNQFRNKINEILENPRILSNNS